MYRMEFFHITISYYEATALRMEGDWPAARFPDSCKAALPPCSMIKGTLRDETHAASPHQVIRGRLGSPEMNYIGQGIIDSMHQRVSH